MMNAQSFVKMVHEIFDKRMNETKQGKDIKFGEIADATGKPTLRLEGEDTVSIKRYPYLASYTPVKGEIVMVVNGVITGKVIGKKI